MSRWRMVVSLLLVLGVVSLGTWQYVTSGPLYQWAEDRVVRVVRPGVLISGISRQERQRAIEGSLKTSPEERQEQIEATEAHRPPEYLPTEVVGEVKDDYLTEIGVPGCASNPDSTIYVRVIEKVDDRRLLTIEPGRESTMLHTDADGSYYVFELGRAMYGLDPESLTVDLLSPTVIGDYDFHELIKGLAELGDQNNSLNWAVSPYIDPTGRYIAYISTRDAVQTALREQDLSALTREPLELWLYDRQSTDHRLVGHLGHLEGWVDEAHVLLRADDHKYLLVDPFTAEAVPLPETGEGAYLLAMDANHLIFTLGQHSIAIYDPTTLAATHYQSEWMISPTGTRASLLSPDGNRLAFLERDNLSSKSHYRLVFIDTQSAAIVHQQAIPPTISFSGYGGWIDSGQFIYRVQTVGPPHTVKEKTLTVRVPGRDE